MASSRELTASQPCGNGQGMAWHADVFGRRVLVCRRCFLGLWQVALGIDWAWPCIRQMLRVCTQRYQSSGFFFSSLLSLGSPHCSLAVHQPGLPFAPAVAHAYQTKLVPLTDDCNASLSQVTDDLCLSVLSFPCTVNARLQRDEFGQRGRVGKRQVVE